MTKEEAIEEILCMKHIFIAESDADKALDMAIEVLQEQKTGKWIEKGRSLGIPESVCYTCSECGNAWWNVKGDWKFCPKCGAEMRGEEE